MSDKLLEELSKSAGVDLMALKEKYSSRKSGGIGTNLSEEAKKADETLSKYIICQTCQGQGIVKSIYNHMVMEKTCEVCDGESVVLRAAVDREIEINVA